MAFDLSMLSGSLMGWLSSMLFWGAFILVLLIISIGFLIIRKNKKLNIPVLECVPLRYGKVGIKMTKGGWLGRKDFFGMYDYGEPTFKLKDGREVQSVSTEDYQEFDGKKCLVCMRKGDDPRVLFPITKIVTDPKDTEMMMAIAPADYREVAIKLMDATERETMAKLEKYLPWIAMGFVAIILLIAIIVIMNSINSVTDKIVAMEAVCKGTAATQNTATAIPSTVAP